MTVPCGIIPILLGMSLGGAVSTLLRATAIITIGSLLFHVSYTLTHLPLFLLIFAVALVALYGMGATFASAFLLWGREAWHTANLFMEPIFLLTGFYFPVRALGFWVAMGASVIPITLALDALRQLLFAGMHPALLPVNIELMLLVGLAVLFVGSARFFLNRMEFLARREGRLSLRF